MKLNEQIEKLSKREITTVNWGKVEMQNNHNHLLCFYNRRLVFSWENVPDENGMTRIKKEYPIEDWTEVFGPRREFWRVLNIFCTLVNKTKYVLKGRAA